MSLRLVPRPRLLAMVGSRWARRAVLIVAGAGFGKSVLLSQAMTESALAPRGKDVIFRCVDRHGVDGEGAGTASVVRGIADAAGIAPASGRKETSAEWLLAELARRWPLGVCVMIDDVHHLSCTEDGARLLARLVNDAPSCVHFVLSGRMPIRGLARARVSGEVVEIGEADLALTDAETTALAELHAVDPCVPASVGGWPAAAAMAAAYGIDGVEEYVFEAVLDHLDDEQRSVVAIATAIGGGDAELLRAAIGRTAVDPVALLSRLPLVGRSESGEYIVHDLWQRVVAASVEPTELERPVARAVEVLVRRGSFDRAFRLCVAHDDWDGAAGVLTACCSHGHVAVLPDVVAGWLRALPDARRDEPEGLLLRGLMGRVTDPFSSATADLLERAVAGYRAAGNVAGEIAAGVELVYVLRNQGRCDALLVFLGRALELDAAGHVEVAGPAAVARALLAELSGDDRRMVTELDAVPAGSLSRDWQAVVAFRQAIAHLTLGDERRMLDAATRCWELADSAGDRHVLALAEWYAGNPWPALETVDEIAADASRSQIGAVLLGSMATMILATAGRVGEASLKLDDTERAASGPVSVLMRGSLVGARSLVAAAGGDDASAAAILEASLADVPLADPAGMRMAARWLPLAYVLVPSTRFELDRGDVGPLHRRRLAVARAVVAAREGHPVATSDLGTITPALVSTTVPMPWAMVLAAGLTADRAAQGREVAEHLLDLFGEPARDALRDATVHPLRRVAEGARRLLAAITMTPVHPVRLDVLGETLLRVGDGEELNPHWKRDRVRSLLLYLVVHGPAHREQIIDALWPHLDPATADRNLRVTLTYLNQVLEPHRRNGEATFFVRQTGRTLTLAGSPHLEVDVREFESFLDRADEADRAGLPTVALGLYEQALQLWRGPCLTDVAYEDWAQATCRDLTARFVGAAQRAAELHLAAGRTAFAVDAARRALAADEWFEPAYGVLIAAALEGRDCGAAVRAMRDCDAMLAELGIAPGEQTEMLRRRLHDPRTAPPPMVPPEPARTVARRSAPAVSGPARAAI